MPMHKNRFKKTRAFLFFLSLFALIGILCESFPTVKPMSSLPAEAEKRSFIEALPESALSTSAKAAALMESSSGDFIYLKNANKRMPMASTTNIMTALVVLSHASLSDTVTVPDDAVGVEGSSVYLRKGESFTVEELLYALMLASANDAAVTLALHVAGDIDAFAEMMNDTARNMGLKNTHFKNPHGLPDDGHYTTARELAIIANEASKNAKFREICRTKRKIIKRENHDSARLLHNHNKLLSLYPGAFGMKTGFTKESGRCLVSGAERDGMTLIAVTLGAPDDWNDHKALLDAGFSRYENVKLADAYEIEALISVAGSCQTTLKIANTEPLSLILPKGGEREIKIRLESKRILFAPVKSGYPAGLATFSINGEDAASLPLFTLFSAAKTNAKD